MEGLNYSLKKRKMMRSVERDRGRLLGMGKYEKEKWRQITMVERK